MVEKNLKKLKARKRRVMNGFNTGTRDMKLKTAYRRKKRWSAEDADHSLCNFLNLLQPDVLSDMCVLSQEETCSQHRQSSS